MSPISGQVARFEARSIAQGTNVDRGGKLDRLKQVFSAKTQLAVYNPGTDRHIASGVSKTQLSSLMQVDVRRGLSSHQMATAEKILGAAGIPSAHLTAGEKLRLATLAVTDPGRAADTAQLKSIGLDAPQMMQPEFRHALAELSRIDGGAAVGLLRLSNSADAAHFPPTLTADILKIAEHSPGLASKLGTLAGQEASGALKDGTTSYMTSCAKDDPFMWDNRPNLDPASLPDAAALGFEPKFHVTLDQAAYTAAAAGLRRLQGEGHLPHLAFDDATRTVHSGYGHIAFSDIAGGLDAAPRTDGTSPQGDAKNFMSAVRDAAPKATTVDGGTQAQALLNERGFGNPGYSVARQAQRFDCVNNAFQKYGDFDFGAFDAKFSDARMSRMKQAVSNGTDKQKIDALLTRENLPGLTISEKHSDTDSKKFIFDNLANFKAAGVTVIAIEHMKHSEFAGLIDEYMSTPPGTAMGPDLKAALKTMDGPRVGSQSIGGILAKIHDDAACAGLRVVGADTENMNLAKGVHSYELRAVSMNAFGEQNIRTALGANEKFVLLAGAAHNNTHVGLEGGMPGFSQIFESPSLRVAGNGTGFDMTFDAEDKTKRTAATANRLN